MELMATYQWRWIFLFSGHSICKGSHRCSSLLHHLKNQKLEAYDAFLSVSIPYGISPTRTVYIRKNSMITRTFSFGAKTVCI